MAMNLLPPHAVQQTDAAEQSPTMLTNTSPVLCAWCLDEQGIPQGEGSHGICPDHAQTQYQLLQARRARRAA